MRVDCPKCASEIPVKDVNVRKLVAKCVQCDNVFRFVDTATEVERRKPRPYVSRPVGIRKKKAGAKIILTLEWFDESAYLLAGFTVLWNIFMLVFVSSSLTSGDFGIFFMPHVWVGIGLIYYVAALFMNSTIITISRSQVIVRHSPLPWFGNATLDAKQIKQLYSGEYWSGRKRRQRYARVVALLENGRNRSIMRGLKNDEQALYIEQQIERHLEIEDKPVAGEISRGM